MLNKYRRQIDSLDLQIIDLLNQRFTITNEVGVYKKANSVPVLQNDREQQIINRIKDCSLDNERQVIEIYKQIMKISKRQQNE